MVRFCCPDKRVDWRQHQGLLCCNWPCCFDATPDDTLRVVRTLTTDTNLIIELEAPLEMVPSFVLLVSSLVIYTPIMLCCLDSNKISAWHITLEGDAEKLVMRRRDKTQYSETISRVFTDIVYAHYLVEEAIEEETSYRYSMGCIVLYAENGETIASPKKKITDDSVEWACNCINRMVPQRHRALNDDYRRRFNTTVPAVAVVEQPGLLNSASSVGMQQTVPESNAAAGHVGGNDGSKLASAPALDADSSGQEATVGIHITQSETVQSSKAAVSLKVIIDTICRELGLEGPNTLDHDGAGNISGAATATEGPSIVEIVRLACTQLGIETKGTVRADAVAAARQLGYDFES